MTFEDPELEPTILPLDARLSLRGSTEEFKFLFDRLTAVTPQKEKIPGTSFVYVIAEDGIVRLTASDGSQTLILETDSLRINREGKALLPAHKLKQIFSLAPEASTSLTILANTATVNSGRAIWEIATPAGEKMPALEGMDAVDMVEVPRRALYKALSAAKRALPGLGSRKSLEQLLVASGAVTASDGNRLIRQEVPGMPKSLRFGIPKDTVEELLRTLAAGGEEHVVLGASNTHIVVRDGSTLLVSRQLVVDFPDVEPQLLTPALENNYRLTIDTNELRDIIKRIRVSADPEYAAVTLHFGKKKGEDWELNVSTRDRSGNSAYEAMFALWEGDAQPFDITLNHKYLTDMLEAYSGNLATIRVGANSKTRAAPLLIKDDDKGYVAVVQQSIAR